MSDSTLVDIMLKANQACEDGLVEQAIHLYSEGLRCEPHNALVYSNRSAAYLLAKDFRSSLSDAENAIELQPTWSKGYLRKGLALQHMRDFEGSVISLAQGISCDTENRQMMGAIVDTLLLSQMKDAFENTQRQLRKLGLDENPFVMLSAIGQDLLSTGRFKTSLSVLKCAEQIDTDNLRLKGSLMSALASAYWRLNNQKLAIGYMEEDLEICRSLGDEQGECRVMGNLGSAHYSLKEYDVAIQYHKDQLLLATEMKSRKTAALALGCLGHNYSAIGEHEQALACHGQCVALAQEMENKVAEAEEYGNIGCLYLSKGDHGRALEYHERHLSVAQEVGDMSLQTKAYFNLATLYQQLQDFSQALKCYQEILTFGVKMRRRAVEMRAYAGLGACTRQIGELRSSLNYYQQYLSIALKIPDKKAASKAYCCIGNVNQALGCLSEALQAHKSHLVKVLEFRDRVAEGRAYGNLGNVHCAMGHYTRAVRLHEQALSIAVEEGDTLSQASTNGNLGIAFQGLGENDKALCHLDAHLTIARELHDEDAQIKALSNLGNFHANKLDFDTAHDLFQEQLEISKSKGDIEAQTKSLTSIGVLYRLEGKMEQSVNCVLDAVSISANVPKLLVKNLVTLAKLYTVREQRSDARGTLQRAYDIQTDGETERGNHGDTLHCEVLSDLAEASLLCGYVETALTRFSTLSDIAQEQQLPLFEMTALSGHGKVNLNCGNFSRAKEYFESAISLCKEKVLRKEEFHQLVSLSQVLCALQEFEDAHSVLMSAQELLPQKDSLSQDEKNLEAELAAALGGLSMAKGDYSDALQHFQTQRSFLVGEEQARESKNIVVCMWLLGDSYHAYQFLENLEEKCESMLETRALLSRSAGILGDAVHYQELRLDLVRRKGDRVSELQVLCQLAASHLVEGHCDQALLHFDQALLISRDTHHLTGECAALVGLAKSYLHMSEYRTCLERCEEVGQCSSVKTNCDMHLTTARAHLALGEVEECVRHANICRELATYHPLLLAAATAVLGQGLLFKGDKDAAHEAIIASCSQFEILLLQKNIDFVYEEVTGTQEQSYSSLLDLEDVGGVWVQERVLRWERARYLRPSSPFPAQHTRPLSELTDVIGHDSDCVILRVDPTVVHTWHLQGDQGLCDYARTDITDKEDIMASEDVGEVLLGNVLRKKSPTLSNLYIVLSEDIISYHFLNYLNLNLFPDTTFVLCGCLDDLGRFAQDRKEEVRSLTPSVFLGCRSDQLAQLCDVIGRGVTSPEDISLYHICHISADQISFSDLDSEKLFIELVRCEAVFLHNTGGAPLDFLNRICLCLLSSVRCVVQCDEMSLEWITNTHHLLNEGFSVFQSVARSSHLLSDPSLTTCFGCDWLPRQPNHVAGIRLMLRSAEEDVVGSALRATLDIVDKMETGFNREGPLSVQYEVLGALLGWREVVRCLGGEVTGDTVTLRNEGADRETIRTLLTSLLDCGDVLIEQIAALLSNSNPDIEAVTNLLEVYLETEETSLPFPADNPHLALLDTLGLHSTREIIGGNVILCGSRETSLLRLEAALFALKTLFFFDTFENPYYSPPDDVAPIEI